MRCHSLRYYRRILCIMLQLVDAQMYPASCEVHDFEQPIITGHSLAAWIEWAYRCRP